VGTGLRALAEVLGGVHSRLMLIDVSGASHRNIDRDDKAVEMLTTALNTSESSVLFHLELEEIYPAETDLPPLSAGVRRRFDEALLQTRRRNVERIGDDDADLMGRGVIVKVLAPLARRCDKVADSEAALGLLEAALASQLRVCELFDGDDTYEPRARVKLANLSARVAGEPEPFPGANLDNDWTDEYSEYVGGNGTGSEESEESEEWEDDGESWEDEDEDEDEDEEEDEEEGALEGEAGEE
jgi:hypothetical protein